MLNSRVLSPRHVNADPGIVSRLAADDRGLLALGPVAIVSDHTNELTGIGIIVRPIQLADNTMTGNEESDVCSKRCVRCSLNGRGVIRYTVALGSVSRDIDDVVGVDVANRIAAVRPSAIDRHWTGILEILCIVDARVGSIDQLSARIARRDCATADARQDWSGSLSRYASRCD